MESKNNEDVDLSDLECLDIKFDTNKLENLFNELKSIKSIENKEKYFDSLVSKRLDKINNSYIIEFDKKLNSIYNSLDAESINNEDFIYRTIGLLKSCNKINSYVYNKFINKILSTF